MTENETEQNDATENETETTEALRVVRARTTGLWAYGVFWFAVGAAIALYWAWRPEQEPIIQWGVSAAVAIGGLVGGIAIVIWLSTKSTIAKKWTRAIGLLLIAVAFGVVPVVLLARADLVLFLKFTLIVILAMLPAFLYLQFLAIRGPTLWSEFIRNLDRLGISHYGTPPREDEQPPDLVKNVYFKKFEAVYGFDWERYRLDHPALDWAASPEGEKNERLRRQGETMVPSLWLTAVLALGWALVLEPEVAFGFSLIPDLELAGRPELVGAALRAGFVGSYFFVLQLLIRRYFQDDLKADAYINAIGRVVSVALLVGIVSLVWPSEWAIQVLIGVSFLIGLFPQIGIDVIWKVIQKVLFLRRAKPSLESAYPLSDLDGLNVFYEQRLVEEGVEDIQNLATADFVELMLHTRIPLGRLVDWVDQGLLYLRLPPAAAGFDGKKDKDENGSTPPEALEGSNDREQLRRYGIRTATDLVDVRFQFGTQEISKIVEREGNGSADDPSLDADSSELRDGLKQLLNDGDEMSRTDAIFESLAREPNLVYVRNWKSWKEEAPEVGSDV